jgi:hypothetical protein
MGVNLGVDNCTAAIGLAAQFGMDCFDDLGGADPTLAGYSLSMLCGCSCPDPVMGCTDQAACNYSADADQDDNSCTCSSRI